MAEEEYGRLVAEQCVLKKDKPGTAGPVTVARLRSGKLLAAMGKGSQVGHVLGADPAPVTLAVAIGAERSCLTFGGTTTFAENKKFQVKDAPAPVTYPP